jgi:hypothetical protein
MIGYNHTGLSAQPSMLIRAYPGTTSMQNLGKSRKLATLHSSGVMSEDIKHRASRFQASV